MTNPLRTRTIWAFALMTLLAAGVSAAQQTPLNPPLPQTDPLQQPAPVQQQGPTPPQTPAPTAPQQTPTPTPAAPVPVTAPTAAPGPVSPITVPPSGAQQAPQTLQAPIDRYQVGQATPEAAPGTALMNLTLEQAMDLALEKNLDLRAARLSPQGVDYQLQAARAAFSPQFTGTYGYNDSAAANNNALESRATVSNVRQTYNMGLSQGLPWYGGRFTANFNNNRQSTNSSITILNPSYGSTLQFNYIQPLLAGFRIDNTRNTLRTLSITRQVADITLLTTIENTKASVRNAYWALRQAIEAIEIQKRSLDLAQRLLQDNRIKVEIGTLAPIETTTSETAVANADQALLQAQINWINAEQNLKRLLAESPEDSVYRATINPIEQASMSVQAVDIPGAVRIALEQRTDLVTARRNLEIALLNLEITADTTKPQLDLSSGYSSAGQGGARLVQSTGERIPGGYGNALDQVLGLDLPTWNVQFNFTYPLFMRAAKANYARAQLEIQRTEALLKSSEMGVTVTVSNAGRAVENAYKQFQAARIAREVAEKNTDAEQTRFDVGMSTNYQVVLAQNNLTQQRLNELNALIRYINAVAEFDRVQRVGGAGN